MNIGARTVTASPTRGAAGVNSAETISWLRPSRATGVGAGAGVGWSIGVPDGAEGEESPPQAGNDNAPAAKSRIASDRLARSMNPARECTFNAARKRLRSELET
jgi:hypothetical protein